MKMDCKNRPPSVIETLMGLNTQSVQKRERKRVLSENYLQKTSSLHFSKKSVLSRTCLSSMQVDVVNLVPTMRYVDQFCNAYYQTCGSDSIFNRCRLDSQDTSVRPRHSRVMKPPNPPKSEHSLQTIISRDAKKSQEKRKHIPFKPSKGHFSVEKYKGPEQDFASEIVNNKLDASKISNSSISFLSDNRIRKDDNLCSSVRAKGKWIMTRRSLIQPRANWDTNWHLISEEANRITLYDTRLHINECNGSSKPCKSEPISTNLDSSPSMVSENESVIVSPSDKSKIRRCEQNVSDGSTGVYESSSCFDFSRLDYEMGLDNQTLETQNDKTYDFDATQTERLFCDADDICQEASQSLSEDTLASWLIPEPLSPTSSEEVSRCSPISVLESLSKRRVPSTMDCFMNGSTHLCEGYSEGLGMTVSSEEDSREESLDATEDSLELSDSSYLLSMLDVACGHGNVNYAVWLSFENPITPWVFQILEEKYGRHVSWPRSDRKLLFDRINLGLTDIAKSCFSIRQISASLRQRFSPCWTRKEVEETLRWLLAIQDKEAPKTNDPRLFNRKNLTAKKGRKSNSVTCKGIRVSDGNFSFLELEDYMDEIIIDIERSLLDGLVSYFFVNTPSF